MEGGEQPRRAPGGFPHGPAEAWSEAERLALLEAVRRACPYSVEAVLVVGSAAMGRPAPGDVDLVVSVPEEELAVVGGASGGLWRYAYFPVGDALTRALGRRFDVAYTNGMAAAWQTDAAGRLLPAVDLETGRLIGRGAGLDNTPRFSVIGHHRWGPGGWRHVLRKPAPAPVPEQRWA